MLHSLALVLTLAVLAVPDAAFASDEAEAETPEAETPEAETSESETPEAETSESETQKSETPEAETPKAETPKSETPEAETPKEETLEAETPGAEVAVPEVPASEAAQPPVSTSGDPVSQLQDARTHYERGEFSQAAETFASVLDSPVRLRTRQDLHEGFLYYAFTLLLQGEPHSSRAAEKLRYALRLDPDHLPSPVTTRPDILAFYNRQRDAYIIANGPVSEPPEIVFPELQARGRSTRFLQRRWFIPAFGIGLRYLGHPKAANALMTTQFSALGINVASLLLRAAVIEDLSPGGFTATAVTRYINYISFSVFWVAIAVDLIVSLSLRRSYNLHPERQPTNRNSRPGKGPPRLQFAAEGLRLEF